MNFLKIFFRKKYDAKLINKIGIIYDIISQHQTKFDVFIHKILSEYIKTNDILKEYIKIFLLNGQSKEDNIEKIYCKIKEKFNSFKRGSIHFI